MSVQLSVHRGTVRTNLSQEVVPVGKCNPKLQPVVQKCQGLQCVEMSFSAFRYKHFVANCEDCFLFYHFLPTDQ